MKLFRSAVSLLGVALPLAGCAHLSLLEQHQSAHPELVHLRGASSSGAFNAYLRWFSQLVVSDDIYAEIVSMGSGEATDQLMQGKVDFAGSEAPLTDQQLLKATPQVLAFPVAATAVAIAYNNPDCELKISSLQLSHILSGKIDNYRQLGCANKPIALVYRGDLSGTTATLNSFLLGHHSAWPYARNQGLKLALPLGRAVRGSQEMLAALKENDGALGYVDAAYVGSSLRVAALQGGDGLFSLPNASAAERALETLQLNSHLIGRVSPSASGYPLVALNWMLVPVHRSSPRTQALRRALTYILGRQGQEDAELLGYIRLPVHVRDESVRQLSRLPR